LNSGLIALVTEPSDVKVYLDGKYQGTTKAKDTDQVSEVLEIDLIPVGNHTLQLSKGGYITRAKTLQLTSDKTINLHEKLERRFIPDTQVRTGDGPDDVRTGVLLEKFENGDIRLEISRGAIITIKADQIKDIKPLVNKKP